MINDYILNHTNIMKKINYSNILLFIPILILNIISLFNMLNAKLISDVYQNAFIKQLLWFCIGYIIIIIFYKIKLKNIFKYSKYFYFFSLFLLFLVLLVGKDINGAKCWLNIFGFSFQPSEIVKITLTLYLIDITTKYKSKTFKDELNLVFKSFIITLIPSILVFLEPDTGAIINYILIFFIILCYCKLNKWWYISIFSSGIFFLSLLFIMYFFYQDTLTSIMGNSLFYRMDRLINFSKGYSYQLENALITIGTSTFLGAGLNNIILYIPEAPTDFFFAFSIGNFGFISAILIIFSFLLINIFLLNQLNKNNNIKNKLFISSYLAIFLFHQVYNIFMNIGLVPIMGIPLPFLSYGGSNIIINYMFIGIILNFISKKHS